MLGWLLRRFRREPVIGRSGIAPSAEVLGKVRRLEIRTRGFVESLFSGEYASVFRGRGMEFSHVRGYHPGDDVRAIDWKVSARRGSTYIRQFVEERDLLVAFIIDVSGSGRFGPGERSAGEIAAEIAAALAFSATRNNDRLALLLVSDRVEYYLPPGSGRKHTVALLSDLVSHRPRGKRTDLTPAMEMLNRSLSGRATVFVISDFIQERTSTFRAALGRLARQHDLIGIRLASPATDELPNVGWVEMTDPESGRRVVIDTGSRGVRDRYRHSVHRAHAEVAALLTEVGAELIDVDTASDPLAPLAEFFRRRQRIKR
jgi:uncharacterized protein (DUF58 family)